MREERRKQFRVRKGVVDVPDSLTNFSKKLGYDTHSHLSSAEKGERPPSETLVKMYEKELGTTRLTPLWETAKPLWEARNKVPADRPDPEMGPVWVHQSDEVVETGVVADEDGVGPEQPEVSPTRGGAHAEDETTSTSGYRVGPDDDPDAQHPPAPPHREEPGPGPTPVSAPVPQPAGPEHDPSDLSVPVDSVPAQSRTRRPLRTLVLVASTALFLAVLVVIFIFRPGTPPLVPDQVGALQHDARYELAVRGYPSEVELAFDDAEAGHVTAQAPVAVRRKKGTTVRLTVSKGPQPVAIPDLTGRTEQEAMDALAGVGHTVGAVTKQHDDRVAATRVVNWSLKGTEPPRGTPVDLVVSLGPAPPDVVPGPLALTKGPLHPRSYMTTKFRPTMTFTVKDGWEAMLESADHVRLAKTGDPQGRRVDVMRIQRVYDRRPFSNQEDALNSVRAFYESLTPWLSDGHGSIKAETIGPAPKIDGAEELTQQVDASFIPYAYEGCPEATSRCVILFQLDPFPPEKLETYAYVAADGEMTRFQIYDVGSAKIVVAMTAKSDVRPFAADIAAGGFTIDRFGDDGRITRTTLEVSPKPGDDPVVTATVMVDGKCQPSDGSTVSIFSQSVAPENRLSERLPIRGGRAAHDLRLIGPGPHRIIVMYDGDRNCDVSVSAPVSTPR